MAKKRHPTEQIVRKLREAKVFLAQGGTVREVCKKLEKENGRLKRLVADKELDIATLKEVAEGSLM